MKNIDVSWTELKNFIDNRSLSCQYLDIGGKYYITAIDGLYALSCEMLKDGGSDQTDFDTNYKSEGNKSFTDADGATVIRPKAAKKGWTYHMCGIEFETSVLNSIYHKDVNGNDLNETTYKLYDSNDNEITVQATADTDCVKTVIEFEPTYDYEIIGGTIKYIDSTNPLNTDFRVWVIAVPDLTPAQGGSKVMVESVNLQYVDPANGVEADGRASKLMAYDATYHTNKLQITVKHPAGGKEKFMLALELFRQ